LYMDEEIKQNNLEKIVIPDSEIEALSDYYKAIGDKLRLAREERGHTLAQIGTAVKLTPSAISNYESGIRQIPVHILITLSTVLGKPLQFFLGPSINHDFQVAKALINAVGRFTDAVYIELLYRLEDGKLYVEKEPTPLIPLPPEIASDHHFAVRDYNAVTDSYSYTLFKYYKATPKVSGLPLFKKSEPVYIEPNPEDLVLALRGDTEKCEIVLYKNVTPTLKPEWQHDPYTVNLIAIATAKIERLVKE